MFKRPLIISSTLLSSTLAVTILSTQAIAAPRDYIYVVGSSTVYPFATVVAERFGKTANFSTPKIESTGSGGGIKLFCEGVGVNTPDVANASRRIKQTEVDTCQKNGVKDIVEVKIGYDGIVLAQSKKTKPLDLSIKDIWLALAKEVPDPKGGNKLVPNPYKTWKDVNSKLPADKIEVYGPPPTSGTRDAFVELAMEGGCQNVDWIKAMKDKDEEQFKKVCHTVREDGAFIEAGENDNLIVQRLASNPKAVGIFGFSFLDQNRDTTQGASVKGEQPDFDSIANGDYPLSRPLFFYVKKAHISTVPGLKEYMAEFTNEGAMGEDGYLADRGLIPLPEDEYEEVVQTVKTLDPLNLAEKK